MTWRGEGPAWQLPRGAGIARSSTPQPRSTPLKIDRDRYARKVVAESGGWYQFPDDRHGRLHSSAALDARQGVAHCNVERYEPMRVGGTNSLPAGHPNILSRSATRCCPSRSRRALLRFASGRPVRVPRAAFIDMHIGRGTLRGEQRCYARSSRWHSATLFTKSVELTDLWHDIPSTVHDMRNHASAQHHRSRAI